MGGALALYHASFLPAAGVVGLSTPYQIKSDPRLVFLPLLSNFFPYVNKNGSDWQDKNAVEDHFSYAKYPSKAILQLDLLLKSLREALPKINMPALLMHAMNDKGVAPENMNLIYKALGTPENKKQSIWLENSGHVITRDMDKEIVFRSVQAFIESTMNSLK